MELAERMRIEREFRQEVWSLLEPQPDPVDLMRGIADLEASYEDHAYLAIILLLLFMGDEWPPFAPVVDEAMQPGSPADRDLRRRAERVARWQVGRLGRRMRRTNDRWARRLDDEAFVDRAFGRDRAGRIATTEITSTINASEMEAAAFGRKHGVRMVGYWYTQQDERVCPICAPLHLKPQSTWRKLFPRGAPAHVNCRCGIRWEVRNRPMF